ncbi:hypothetical protein LJY25_03530 [Hymenobacter sp. BT175]|uniref:DUF6756 family protein n=1 Tax=Hymenobacter translucens TaxID=2886507 RepID=UPI001D0F0A3C|nr:DUF6756 family protein [Hymenobacter translucens]MCC2545502.1 hypothetical protein [Hymenobacter translucens]
MWSDLRVEIEQARQALQLAEQDFAPLSITTDWRELEERVYQTFCELFHPTVRPLWLWEHFKPGAYALVCEQNPLAFLTSLIDPGEVVWLMLNEMVKGKDKFWLYQGTPHAIYQVLADCYSLDEVYLISKKYAWLLCLNHHDVAFALGTPMSEKLMAHGAKPIS